MAMRSISTRFPVNRMMERIPPPRYFSDDKGRIFSEEEKAAENIYIRKMEKERLEKLKKKAEKEKAAAEKESKKPEDTHK